VDPLSTARRVLVIGLDGATLDLALPWMRAGYLPTLARLMQQGGGGRLRSVLPVLSPSAWASFATGVNPGRHGIFDFAQRMLGSYDLRLITARDVKAPTLWRLLSDAGKRVAVINVPMTYPAESVNGIMITGLGTPDRQVFTYPPDLTDQLRARGYHVNKTVFYRPGGEAEFLKETYETTQQVADIALETLRQEPWDFFMVVFRDTDEMAHFFWKHMDSSHPAHNPATDAQYADALLNYYQYLDQLTGQLIEAASPNTDVIIMSDHGLGPLYKDVYLNEWLRQNKQLSLITQTERGYRQLLARTGLTRSNISRSLQKAGLAKFERSLRAALGNTKYLLPANSRASFPQAIDWPNTRWYSYGYHGQLFLNVEGREPQGVVKQGAPYRQLRDEMEQLLSHLTDPDDGLPVVSSIIPQEQAFNGPHADLGADLVVIMRDLSYITRHGYEFTESAGRIFDRPTTFESGSHRLDGLLIFSGGSFRSIGLAEPHSIMDIAPTILSLLDVPIPNHIEGRIHHNEMIESISSVDEKYYDYVSRNSQDTIQSANALSPDEESELVNRLKALGYLE
jgi:predicted AlkP superfamily phosphohydrolase/phosphomutase